MLVSQANRIKFKIGRASHFVFEKIYQNRVRPLFGGPEKEGAGSESREGGGRAVLFLTKVKGLNCVDI